MRGGCLGKGLYNQGREQGAESREQRKIWLPGGMRGGCLGGWRGRYGGGAPVEGVGGNEVPPRGRLPPPPKNSSFAKTALDKLFPPVYPTKTMIILGRNRNEI
jgi:hypothetical protein